MLNNIKSFGLNVIPEGDRSRTAEQTAKSVENALSSLWEPILDYLKENENVFSGAIQGEIEKTDFQAMRLGMTLNAGNPTRNINYES